MKRLLAVASSLNMRVLLSLGYGCGLRASEIVRLKVKHIDSAQNVIRIEQSKSRNVMLSAELLDLLRQWWKAGRCDLNQSTACERTRGRLQSCGDHVLIRRCPRVE